MSQPSPRDYEEARQKPIQVGDNVWVYPLQQKGTVTVVPTAIGSTVYTIRMDNGSTTFAAEINLMRLP